MASETKSHNTPQCVKDIENDFIHTVEIPLIDKEIATLKEIQEIIVGNGNLKKREADCMHVFEAQKYGGYFVTSDTDIIKHAKTFEKIFGLFIVKPSKFLEIVKKHI